MPVWIADAASPFQAQTAWEDRQKRHAMIGHAIAITLTLGFLGFGLVVLLGFVNLSDPTASALAGSIVGFAVARLDPILAAYFNSSVSDIRQVSQTAPSAPQAPQR
jgi:hypothetical protein